VVDALTLLDRGRRREAHGDDRGALTDFEHAAELARTVDDPSTEVSARAGLVRLHHAAGRGEPARVELERIDDRLASASVGSIARAEALAERSLIEMERGDDARGPLEEAVALAAGGGTTEQAHRVHVRALIYLAQTGRLRGDYGAALTTLEQALRIVERELGVESQEAADVLNAIGILGKFSGDFDAAQRAYERAGRIITGLYGPEHRDMAAIYHNRTAGAPVGRDP
jgi:tetratricopeptide (TPR) repeat protein